MRLIDADALLIDLNAAWEDNVLSTLRDAVNIITNAPTVEREGWVSVEDRLPEKYTEVIVYPSPTYYCITAQYGKFSRSIESDTWYYGEYLAGYGHENNTCKVTHWQPLPAAPKE
jgi:hypothetical protein